METLAAMDGLVEVSQHRFGGHPSPSAWEPQLRAVAGIVHRVPVVMLREPSGLAALEEAIPNIAEELLRIASDPSVPGLGGR